MADGSIIIDTRLDTTGVQKGIQKLQSAVKTGLTAVTGAATAFAGYAVKVGSDFEASMSKVQAISGATAEEIGQLEAKAKEMGASTKFSATESAEALQYMAMAGWKTNDMLGGLEGIMNLAAASGEDLALTSDIVTDALTAFGLKASDSGHFADVLAKASSNANTNVAMMGYTFKYAAPLAGALGYSIEDTALAIGLMANAGIKSETAGTALRSMFSNLTSAVELTGDKLGKYVIDTQNADGSMVPLKETLDDLRYAFSQMTEAEKTANAESIAGKEAMSGLLAIVNASEADYEKLANAIADSDGAAKEMAETMQDNLQGKFTIMKSALEGLGISFYDYLETPLKEVVDEATDYLVRLNNSLKNVGLVGFSDSWKQILGEILEEIAAKGPEMIKAAGDLILDFLDGIEQNSDEVAAAGVELVIAFSEAMLKVTVKLADVGLALVVSLVQYLVSNASRLGPVALNLVVQFVTGLISGKVKLAKPAKELIEELAGKLKTNITSKIPEVGRQLVNGLIQGIKSGWGNLKGFVGGWANDIVNSVKSKFGIHSPSAVFRDQVGRMLGLGMMQGLESTEELLIDTVETIGERLIDANVSVQEKLKLLDIEAARERAEAMEEYGIENIDAMYNAFVEAEQSNIEEKQARLEEIELALQKDKNDKKLLAEQEALQNDVALLEEFKSNYEATYQDMVSAYEKAYDAIMDKQTKLEEKLQAFGELYEALLDEDGRATGEIRLADLQGQIDTITAYGDSLEALKAKGSVTQEFLDEILAMSVEDGLKYMQLLLDQTDEDFDNYLNLWKEKQKKSKEIAQKYYKDQFELLKRDFNDKIQKQMGLLPDQARKIGLDAAKNLAQGIRNNSGQVFSAIDAIIAKMEEMEAAANAAKWAAEEAASAQSEYAAAASYSITNDSRNISQNVNFYSNTPTPAESYRAVRQAGKELAGL